MITLDNLHTIAILGSGTMGHGIAEVFARAGYEVQLYDIESELLDTAKAKLEQFTAKSVRKGKLTDQQRTDSLARITYTNKLGEIQAQFVLEAVIEKLSVKQELFQELESLLPEAVFATNTSSLSVTAIASKLKDPSKLVGMHFFNPAPIMKLVEVISTAQTADSLTELTVQLAEKLGKSPAQVADTPGFIVNRVARFFYLEGLKVVEEQVADHETVDRLMQATGFRMGPFQLMDLIGVEANHRVSQTMYDQMMGEARFQPSRLQQKQAESGHHGRKTGKGFYDYT